MKVGAEGGIEAVVKAINTHTDNSGVRFVGCGALWSMTINNGKCSEKTHQSTKLNSQLRIRRRQ